MTIDRYMKAVLTVIAIGLILMGLNPWVQPTPSEAGLMDSQFQAIAPPTDEGGLYILDTKNQRLRFCVLNPEFKININPAVLCSPWIDVK